MSDLSIRAKKAIFWLFATPFLCIVFLMVIGLFLGNERSSESLPKTAPEQEALPLQKPKEVYNFHYPDTSRFPYKRLADEGFEYLSSCSNTGDYSEKDCMDLQDQFLREYINAHSGDYLAISNVSTMFSEPLAGAVRVNNIQSCAWRLVLMRSGSPYLSDLDKDITKNRCQAVGGVRDETAVARANEILKILRSHRIHPIAVPQVHYDPKRDRDEQTADE